MKPMCATCPRVLGRKNPPNTIEAVRRQAQAGRDIEAVSERYQRKPIECVTETALRTRASP
jgi:hypothetical protein